MELYRLDPSKMECSADDANLFLIEINGKPNPDAKEICDRCKIEDLCLLVALGDKSLQGTWGGTSDTQRNAIRKNKRQKTAI